MTNLNHFLSVVIILSQISKEDATMVAIPDAVRCWTGERVYTHFTVNPNTNEVSGIRYPVEAVKEWSKELLNSCSKVNSGKPGNAVIDEATDAEAFWRFNSEVSLQNVLMYLHLIQDRCYDDYIRILIDTRKKYDDIFVFDGKTLSGNDLRGKGEMRWQGEGLLNQLDTQVFVRLAKVYYEKTGILVSRQWIEDLIKPAFYKAYSKELAENTVRFLNISDYADEMISTKNFDVSGWPVSNRVADQFVQILFTHIQMVISRFSDYLK